MTEPKLLTEADIDRFGTMSREAVTAELRERGLIAEEPVDPLLKEAREIAARYYDGRENGLARNMRQGLCDHQPSVVSALTALRRGMELGRSDCNEALAPRKELTREMVQDVVEKELRRWPTNREADAILAALLERLQ